VSEKRVRAYRHGLFAETIPALLLRLKGHRIIARRYKTPVGEIDLVALKGKRLAFVEVKQRKTFDEAGWSLPTRAPRRIVRAAQYWLAGHPDFAGHDIAFDVVLAAPWVGRDTSRMRFRCNGSYCIRLIPPPRGEVGTPLACRVASFFEPPSPSRGGMEFGERLCI
jgi:putative endonuclease